MKLISRLPTSMTLILFIGISIQFSCFTPYQEVSKTSFIEEEIINNNSSNNLKPIFNLTNAKTQINSENSLTTFPVAKLFETLTDHEKSVRTVAFSPDGKTIASGSTDETIILWDLSQGNQLPHSPLFGYSGIVYSVSFSPDGRYLASGYSDGSVYLWNMDSGTAHNFNSNHVMKVTSVTFSPNGNILASGSDDGTIALWNISTKTPITSLSTGTTYGVLSIVFSPDGSLLISGHEDGSIILWDTSTWEIIFPSPLIGHYGGVYSLTFRSDLFLASSGEDGFINVWNLATEDQSPQFSFKTDIKAVDSIDFSPDGSLLISSSLNGTIRLWNVNDGTIIQNITGHIGRVFSVTFSPDGSMLASGGLDQKILVWNLATYTESWTLANHTQKVTSVAFSTNNLMLASGSQDTTVKIWNLTTRNEMFNLKGHNGLITTIAWSPNSEIVVSGSTDGMIRVWNITTGLEFNESPILAHGLGVSAVAFSPNGSLLASGGADWNVKLWNTSNWTEIGTLEGHTLGVSTVAFSHNGVLASGSYDMHINLWNVSTLQELPRSPLIGHTGPITSIGISSGGILASASWDSHIRLWNMTTGEELSQLKGHTDHVSSLSYSSDGKILVSGSLDNTARIWNMTTEQVITLFDEAEIVNSVSVSANRSMLALGNNRNEIKLWPITSFPVDSDSDGMNNVWEWENNLDPLDFSDKFLDLDQDELINSMEYFLKAAANNNDTDSDSIPDGWEYLAGFPWISPIIEDSNSDSDQDNIPAWYEYKSRLNPRIDDAALDLDNDNLSNLQEYYFGSLANQFDSDSDSMSDYYEFIYNFNASDPLDAKRDSDGDWLSNRFEIKEGSNPRIFFSVPFWTLSAFHVLMAILFFLLFIFGLYSFNKAKVRQRMELIAQYKAPDYLTAIKIQNTGIDNFSTFTEIENKAKSLFEDGWTSFLQERHSKAVSDLEKALKLFEQLKDEVMIANTLCRLILIQKAENTLTNDTKYLERFPQPPYVSTLIKSCRNIIDALIAEVEKNWKQAMINWQAALISKEIEDSFQMICQKSLIEAEYEYLGQKTVDQLELQELRIGVCIGSLTNKGMMIRGRSDHCPFNERQLNSILEYSAVWYQHGESENLYGPFPQKTSEKTSDIEWHFFFLGFRTQDESSSDSRVIKQGGMVPALFLVFYQKEFDPIIILKRNSIESSLNRVIKEVPSISEFTPETLNEISHEIMTNFIHE